MLKLIQYTVPLRDPALGLHIQPKTYQLSHVTNIIVNSSCTREWIKEGPCGNVQSAMKNLFQFSVRFRMWTYRYPKRRQVIGKKGKFLNPVRKT
jgi:hypothetical protein